MPAQAGIHDFLYNTPRHASESWHPRLVFKQERTSFLKKRSKKRLLRFAR